AGEPARAAPPVAPAVRPAALGGRVAMDAPERLEWLGVTLARVTAVAALGVLAWLAARRRGPALRGAVVFAALTGLLAVPARAAVGLALLYRWVWRAEPVPQEEWAACLEPDAGRPRVAVRESPAVDSPLTLGLFRPIILLPAGWREWSAEQLGLVLAHELAHVRRCDFL